MVNFRDMIRSSYSKYLFYFIIFLIIFFLDRVSKIYIINIASNNGFVDIYINNFLNIILVWNSGIAFGLLSSENNNFYHIITLIIILINIFIIYMTFTSDKIRSFFLVVILGGSLGNLFDRIYYSAVPDFIDLNYNGFHWFIFNFADVFITLGIICLILIEFLEYKKVKNEK